MYTTLICHNTYKSYQNLLLISFLNIKKSVLTNLKKPGPIFLLISISNITNLKNTTFYTNNNPHKNHYTNNSHKNDYKHKGKYIITACVPIFIIKKFLLFFFIVYRNEWKEHKF